MRVRKEAALAWLHVMENSALYIAAGMFIGSVYRQGLGLVEFWGLFFMTIAMLINMHGRVRG